MSIEILPNEILSLICHHLSIRDLHRFSRVSKGISAVSLETLSRRIDTIPWCIYTKYSWKKLYPKTSIVIRVGHFHDPMTDYTSSQHGIGGTFLREVLKQHPSVNVILYLNKRMSIVHVSCIYTGMKRIRCLRYYSDVAEIKVGVLK